MSTIEKRDEAIDLARYKQAASEVETGNRDDALWYKAFAEGGGDENATKATYIRLRVEQLRRAAVAASAVRVTSTQPSPAYTPAAATPTAPPTLTARPKPNGAKSLYDVLGIPRDANDEQILAGYQTQKSILDARENQDAETKNSLIFIQHAKEVLLDPAKRAAYDARITAEAAQPEKVVREKSSGSRPTNTSEPLSNHDLYAAYLGEKNQDYYLNKFEEFDRLGDGLHASWNWPAFFIFFIGNALWPLYRKMYGLFFTQLIVGSILLSIVNHLNGGAAAIWFLIWISTAIGVGMLANNLYFRKVSKVVASTKKNARNDDELLELLGKKGGVHAWAWWILWAWLVVAVIGIIAAIVIPAFSDSTNKAKPLGARHRAEQPANQPPTGNQPSIESAKFMFIGKWTCKTETGEDAGTAYTEEYRADFTSGTSGMWEFLPDGTLWVHGTLYYGDKNEYSISYSEVYKLNWISASEFIKQTTGNKYSVARCFKTASN